MDHRSLKAAYDRGENITALLREATGAGTNSEAIIELAYDLQTGAYIAALDDPAFLEYQQRYSGAIADVLTSLGPVGTQANTFAAAGDVELTRLRMIRNWVICGATAWHDTPPKV